MGVSSEDPYGIFQQRSFDTCRLLVIQVGAPGVWGGINCWRVMDRITPATMLMYAGIATGNNRVDRRTTIGLTKDQKISIFEKI